jgi:hypothetical protein
VFRVTTAANVVVNGGKVRVYNANTTTLASLYSDTGLTTPLTNPVVADSDGWAPQIFCASANYDVAILDASNNVLDSIDDVPAVGSDGSTFSKDFTNSRVQIRGSGGITYWETGDASPDNTGGTGRLGGWNGTQADSWTADAALFNVTGRIKENSKKLAGVVYTEATTFAGVTQVDITLPNDPTGVRAYEVEIWDFGQAGNGNISLRTSHDSGGTYKSGAADYDYMYNQALTGTGNTVTAHTTATSAQITSNMNGAANKSGRITFDIVTPTSGNEATVIRWRADGIANTGEYTTFTGFAFCGATYGRATNIRLLISANTMNGKYLVRPKRGYGET